MTDFSSPKQTLHFAEFLFPYRRCNKVLNHAPFYRVSFSSSECATLGSVGVLCVLSVCVCVCILGVPRRASVGLQGQLALKVFNNALQALPSFSLLLKLLSQLLTIRFCLLQLQMQLFDLHHTTQPDTDSSQYTSNSNEGQDEVNRQQTKCMLVMVLLGMIQTSHLSGILDSETFGLTAFVTDSQLSFPLQLSLQPPTGLLRFPHLPLPVDAKALNLLSQIALGFDGLKKAAFLCHPHKLQFL